MKKFHTLLVALLITATPFAQSPEGISYQAVVRDGSDILVSNAITPIQISILKDATAIYVETQTPTTNNNGLLSIEIGGSGAIVVSGVFSDIIWGTGTYFIKTEVDVDDNGSYDVTGTSQLLSVPYALHAKTVENITEVDGSITNEIELPTSANAGDMSYWNGASWVVIARTTNEGATLQMIGGVPTWTGGTPTAATIGDFREGGIVFWVDPTDPTHGLVCAVRDQSSSSRWNDGADIETFALATSIGMGSSNTDVIIAVQGQVETNYAAGLARAYTGGGFNDWFLPSKNELNQMYLNEAAINATAIANSGTSFALGWYWSSSEFDRLLAWNQLFGDVFFQDFNGKYDADYVRAVRAF